VAAASGGAAAPWSTTSATPSLAKWPSSRLTRKSLRHDVDVAVDLRLGLRRLLGEHELVAGAAQDEQRERQDDFSFFFIEVPPVAVDGWSGTGSARELRRA
jgi:hypothetical protein